MKDQNGDSKVYLCTRDFLLEYASFEMRLVPKPLMEIVEEGAVGVCCNNNANGCAYFLCKYIKKE
jgi:hypothetical protein